MNEMDIENNNQFLHYLPESEEVHFIVKDARQIENSSNCIKSKSAATFHNNEKYATFLEHPVCHMIPKNLFRMGDLFIYPT